MGWVYCFNKNLAMMCCILDFFLFVLLVCIFISYQTLQHCFSPMSCFSPDLALWLPSLRIYTFRSTWPCLIVKVVAAQIKFPQPSADCTAISCVFTFYTANVFGCFWGVMDQFKLVKHNFLNSTLLHIHLCSFQITHTEWNIECVSKPTTTILSTMPGTFQGLNHFGYVIYAPKTSIYC